MELRRAGVIRAIGVGLNETAMSLRFAREADLDCIMLAGRYTLLEQGALDELLPLCEKKNMSILLAAPLNSGILATGARADATYDYSPHHCRSSIRSVASRRFVHAIRSTSRARRSVSLGPPAPSFDRRGGAQPAGSSENMARMSRAIPPTLARAERRIAGRGRARPRLR